MRGGFQKICTLLGSPVCEGGESNGGFTELERFLSTVNLMKPPLLDRFVDL